MDYIRRYNDTIRAQLLRSMEYHGISSDAIEPETVEHVKKCLGVWDFDGHYARFKFCRAKCYCFEYSDDPRNDPKIRGKFGITVAGLGKVKGTEFLTHGWYYDIDGTEHNSPFERFTTGLYVPAENTGKLTHTYIDRETEGYITDYLGNVGQYHELSSVHLGTCDFSMDIADKFVGFLRGVIDES